MKKPRWIESLVRHVERRRAAMGDREAGQAMVEFVIVFPLQFFFTVALMQYAFILMARNAVDHSAWYAARAAMVAVQDTRTSPQVEAQKAAEQYLLPIAGRTGAQPHPPIRYPGWGDNVSMDRSDAVQTKTVVTILTNDIENAEFVTVEVVHEFELVMPVANYIFSQPYADFIYMKGSGGPVAENEAANAKYGYPHIVLHATRQIPKPWKDPQN